MFCPQWHLCVLQNQFLQKLRRCCLIVCQVCWPRVVSETCRTPAIEAWTSHSCCRYQFKVFLFYSWYVGRGRVSNCGTRLCLWAQQLYSTKLQSKSSIFELPWQCTTVRREPLSQWKPQSYRATCSQFTFWSAKMWFHKSTISKVLSVWKFEFDEVNSNSNLARAGTSAAQQQLKKVKL